MSVESSVDTSVQEGISKILKDDRQNKDTDEDFEPSEIQERKLTVIKGRSWQTEKKERLFEAQQTYIKD